MDIDAITLECLMNPAHYERLIEKTKAEQNLNNDKQNKIKFYKKRIINLTKNMLKNEYPTNILKNCFDDYTNHLIAYFEFLDKKDILQKEYDNLNTNKTINPDANVLPNANQLLIKSTPEKVSTLDNFINIKQHNTPTKIIPLKKKINITDPMFKTKGVPPKKKNIIT